MLRNTIVSAAKKTFIHIEKYHRQINATGKKDYVKVAYSCSFGNIRFTFFKKVKDRQSIEDERYQHVNNIYSILDHYLGQIATKTQGLEILATVKLMASQKIEDINNNIHKPSHEKFFYAFLISSIDSISNTENENDKIHDFTLMDQYLEARITSIRRGSIS